jgi:hypothetical protein
MSICLHFSFTIFQEFCMPFRFNRMSGFVTMMLLLASLLGGRAFADDLYGSIRGNVTDATGAAIVGATVTATNTKTGVTTKVKTDNKGRYDFVQLAVGDYSVEVMQAGFKSLKTDAITLVVNQVYSLDVPLSAGGAQDVVEVKGDAVQVDREDVQLKTLFTDQQIVDLPLISRNFTALEQLAPGVQASSDRFGTYSANGSQSNQSSYLINGQDSNDLPLNTASIVPSPDAISQFNLITSTLNAEYGRNSGAIVNALIKSGTNTIHGSGFEFYRDTFLDSKNFFQFVSGKPVFHQNEYGGTIGGPIIKDKTFLFLSYQGLRSRALNATENLTILNSNELNGNFTGDPAITSKNTIPFAITGPTGACGPNTPNTTWVTCFNGAGTASAANNTVAPTNFNSVAKTYANTYIGGKVNTGTNGYIWNANTIQAYDQGIIRLDETLTAKDSLWFTTFFQSSPSTDDVPFTGATVPGFGDSNARHYKQFIVSYTHTFSSNIINEFRVGYTRFNYGAVDPQKPTQPSSLGFQINSQNTAAAGLPYVSVGGNYAFALGFSTNGPQPRKDQTYQLNDNFTIVRGAHSVKLGIDARRFQVDNPFSGRNNGSYSFTAAGKYSSGNAGLDFLLGIPDSYSQGSGGRIDAKAYETYSFIQDTWKATSSLVLDYGIGYQLDTTLDNLQNKGQGVNCVSLAGAQSKVFPTAPAGILFPGDAGCTKSGYNNIYDHFGPRFGFDYSPELGMLTGGSAHKLAIRGGFGYYFNRAEEELSLQNLGAVPYSQNSSGAGDLGGSPAFINPYADVTGNAALSEPNKFPFVPPTPGAAVSFGQFTPLSLSTTNPKLTAPQSMNFNLNVQRELPSRMVAQVGYVGSLGRHLIRAYENNPITLAGIASCAATPACVTGRTTQHYNYPTHSVLPGNILASDGQQSSDGSSNYNSLQGSIHKDPTHGFSFLAAYTYAHALDNASGYENSYARPTNPYPQYASLNYGDSGYDARHRFVISYTYELPIPSAIHGFVRTALGSIKFSGITTVATVFHFAIIDSGTYSSLSCDSYTYYGCEDIPNRVTPGKIQTLNARSATGLGLGSYTGSSGLGGATATNPATTLKTNLFFQPANFTHETGCGQQIGCTPIYGQFGNAGRDSVHGPGINNTDLQLSKVFTYHERARVELRIEGYNIFNHTQFSAPSGNANSTNFGRSTSAASGRTAQLAGKFYF